MKFYYKFFNILILITLYLVFNKECSASINMKLKYIDKDETLLRRISKKVKFNEETLSDAKILLDTLKSIPNSAGLSAIQIGIEKRIVAINWPKAQEKYPNIKFPLVMLNPEIINHSNEKIEVFEGCLSIPYDYNSIDKNKLKIKRYRSITVKYYDLSFKEQIITISHENDDDILLKCLQHEIDHLDGILYIDHLQLDMKQLIELKSYKFIKQHNTYTNE